MDALLKILLADEKKMTQLAIRYRALNKNVKNETTSDRETRNHLAADIAALKKTNALIVSHCLNERMLTLEQIDKIKHTHIAA